MIRLSTMILVTIRVFCVFLSAAALLAFVIRLSEDVFCGDCLLGFVVGGILTDIIDRELLKLNKRRNR